MALISRCAWILLLYHLPIPAASAQWPPEIVTGTRVQAKLPEAQFQPVGRRGTWCGDGWLASQSTPCIWQ
jgi:hypothetical protein